MLPSQPKQPKPSMDYVAKQRQANKPPPQAKIPEEIQQVAPFWMIQSWLGASVPDTGIPFQFGGHCLNGSGKKNGYPKYAEKPNTYNDVDFTDVLKRVDKANGGSPPCPPDTPKMGEYIAMGSFFADKTGNNTARPGKLLDRYYLVKVGDHDYVLDGTHFAPAGSYILCFSATEGEGLYGQGILQDGFCGPCGDWKTCELSYRQGEDVIETGYCVYKNDLEAHDLMFKGVPDKPDCDDDNPMRGVTEALDHEGFVCSPPDGDEKKITIVGWSLGGAQAQIAAVEIAKKYNAKVRLITFDSILAFTPESAFNIDKCMIDKDAIGDFPAAGKINSQRWVMDGSPASIAPFLWPMAGLWPCPSPVGCYPFLSKLGDGHISEALVLRGYNAGLFAGPPSWDTWGCVAKLGCVGALFACLPACLPALPKTLGKYVPCWPGVCIWCNKPTYPVDSFDHYSSHDRTYVPKQAYWMRIPGYSCAFGLCGGMSHLNNFLLWTLYKGAYQNKDASKAYSPKVSEMAKS